MFRFEYFLLQSGIEHFNQLELHHVNTYIESLAGYSPGVVGATVGTLKRLFDYALAEGYHYISYANAMPCIRRTKKYRLPQVAQRGEDERKRPPLIVRQESQMNGLEVSSMKVSGRIRVLDRFLSRFRKAG